MHEHEKRIRAAGKGVTSRNMDASHLLESTDLLLSQLRDLRMGRPPRGQSLKQQAALMQIKEALEFYRSIFYPPPVPDPEASLRTDTGRSSFARSKASSAVPKTPAKE